jgi:transposase
MKYSPSKNGFYHPAVHGINVPPDAVEITVGEHHALLAAQAQGKVIQPDENGRPVAVDPPVPPPPPAPTYDEQRRAAILEKWPLPAQLEALTEAAESPQRPEKLTALLADIQGIKELYPKPEPATESETPAGV